LKIFLKAGIEGTKVWSTGVNGRPQWRWLLDIYVCNAGNIKATIKKNELFINNGNNTFERQMNTILLLE
jgi:hypothetical protein